MNNNRSVNPIRVILLLFLIVFLIPVSSKADTTPTLNEGKKWRIGYYEGGAFSEYTNTMRTFIKALIELGWIQEQSAPEMFREMPKPYWKWLSECKTSFMSFSPDDGYSANWDNQERIVKKKAILGKLKAKKLDIVIAMGTWAGQDLANNDHSIPTIVMSTSDPIKAGIIKSIKNSGYEHVTARVDPERYLRQVRMFHRIVKFKTLGLAFENTPEGRIYSAVEKVQQVSEERGFKVITCEVIDTTTDIEKSDRSCLDCYRQLAQKADAVYVTALTCVDRRVPEISEILTEAKIPSFAQIGSQFVEKGLMLSISSDTGYKEQGLYNATKFAKILNGTKPGTLDQVLEDPPKFAVNVKTADQIGFKMPKGIMRIATEIYDR